jgi:hypothetical protein
MRSVYDVSEMNAHRDGRVCHSENFNSIVAGRISRESGMAVPTMSNTNMTQARTSELTTHYLNIIYDPEIKYIIIIYFNCKRVFTRWQWKYNKDTTNK